MTERSTPPDYGHDWEANAREDAFYSILTSPDKRAGWDEASFFAAGDDEVARVFAFTESAGIDLSQRSRFLDFGCGVGRNTRALMKRFDSGIGIDISPTMISLARRFSAPDPKAAEYVVNSGPDVAFVPTGSVDFVYSHIVLQHIPSALQMGYIADFVRVLAPGGVAAFQVITGWHAPTLIRAAKRVLTPYVLRIYRRIHNNTIHMEMNPVDGREILRLCGPHSRAVIVQAPYTNSTDPSHGGRIEFTTRDAAVRGIRERATDSDFLSQFFFVRKLAT